MDILEKYVNDLRVEQKANNTIIRYKSSIKEFIEEVGDDITSEKLLGYKAKLMQKNKPSTVNSKLNTVNDYLKRMGINLNPIKLLNIRKSFFLDEDILLTTEEINRLENYCRKHNNYRMYYLMETYKKTGIRVSEHEFITAEAVKKGVAIVINKGSIRKVIIPKQLKKDLMNYIEIEGIKEGPVFITKNDTPVDRRNIWSELQTIGGKLGIEKAKLHPHNFRHYFARRVYNKTKDIAKVAALLGHSSIETTRNYLKFLLSDIVDDMNEVEEKMDKAKEKAIKKEQKRSQKNNRNNNQKNEYRYIEQKKNKVFA